MNHDHYIEEANLSMAWGQALKLASARGRSELAPLIVAITGFDATGSFQEEPRIRAELNTLLAETGKQTVDTVANTIFPFSLWNPHADRAVLFHRYLRIVPRLKRASHQNSRGIYFERMITGGPEGRDNQLKFALDTYLARSGVRRGILQIGVFDPRRDHSAAALLGFPCLQHLSFAPTKEGLCMNAFYATQYMVERAYGNYVGLCRLGRFVAHEMKMPLARLTCFTGIAECETPKNKLAGLLKVIDTAVASSKPEGS